MVRVVEKSLFGLREVLTLRRQALGLIQEYGMLLQAATGVRKALYRSGMTRQTLARLVETERGITLR